MSKSIQNKLNLVLRVMEIAAVSFISFFIFQIIQSNIKLDSLFVLIKNPFSLIAIVLLFALSHFFRMTRLYFLLMENRISIKQLSLIYFKTTLVNFILPFKIGEGYRAIVFGNTLNDVYKGFILVWIDRFFDTVVMLLIGLILVLGGQTNPILPIFFVLLSFTTMSCLLYISFTNTYRYFNNLILVESHSKMGIFYLRVLDELNKLFIFAKELIRGRSLVLFVLSILIWIFEYSMLNLIFNKLSSKFSLDQFFHYLNQAFFIGSPNNEFVSVIILSIILLFVGFVALVIIGKRGDE